MIADDLRPVGLQIADGVRQPGGAEFVLEEAEVEEETAEGFQPAGPVEMVADVVVEVAVVEAGQQVAVGEVGDAVGNAGERKFNR